MLESDTDNAGDAVINAASCGTTAEDARPAMATRGAALVRTSRAIVNPRKIALRKTRTSSVHRPVLDDS